MKTKTMLVAALFALPMISHAYPARYSIKGKCYSIALNSAVFNAYFLGDVTGASGYDCVNASENLEQLCKSRAQAAGLSNWSVYKDLWVVGKSASAEAGSSYSQNRSRVLFGLIHSANGFSVSSYRASSAATQVQPVPLDDSEGKDCKVNKRYPQEEVPTLQDENFGG